VISLKEPDTLDREDRTGFDPTTGTYHRRFDPDDAGSVSVAVIEAVAAVTGRGPTSLRPLTEATDADALGSLVAHRDSECEVTFVYEGCAVTVASWGDVTIRRLSDGGRESTRTNTRSE
jgi:hypothetical protein